MNSSLKKTSADVIFMGVTQVILGIQSFLLLPLLSRLLGVEQYGIWSQVQITILLLSGLSILGLDAAIIRFLSGETNLMKQKKGILTVLLFAASSAILMGLLVLIFASPISTFLTGYAGNAKYFMIIPAILLAKVIHNALITFFRAKEDVKSFSHIELARSVFYLIAVLFALTIQASLFEVLLIFLCTFLLSNFLSILKLRKEFAFSKQKEMASWERLRQYLSFSIPLAISPLLWWILQTGDQYVLGYFKGASVVGAYALAYALCRIIRVLIDPLFLVIQPAITRSWNQNNQQLIKRYFHNLYKFSFMIAIPAATGLSVLANPILKVVSTSEFLLAANYIWVISCGVVFYIFFQLAALILNLENKTKNITLTLCFLALLNIVLNTFLVPIMGGLGAAVSTSITFGIAAIIGCKIIKSANFSLQLTSLSKSLISSTVMFFSTRALVQILQQFQASSLWQIAIVIPAGVLIYFLTQISIKGLTLAEIKFIRASLRIKY